VCNFFDAQIFLSKIRVLAFSVTNKMRNILKNRLALSTVVTTLIILVVSVLLAGVVTYFAINVTSTRVQEESLALTKQHVWYNSSDGSTQAAILIINTGGRDVALDKLSVRGQQVDWSDVFYGTTDDSISADLTCDTEMVAGDLAIGSVTVKMAAGTASNDLTLQSGYSMVIYITSPDSITINDIGLTVAMTVFTGQAMYYKECNVQAA
jgi:TPP-dependent 2-oxoacid decarboxylase